MTAWGFLPYANFGSLGIRRATWDAVGGADEDLHHSDDVAFCWSVQLAGTKLVFAPDAGVRFRHPRGARGYFRQEWVSGLEGFTLYDRFRSRRVPDPAPGV